MNSGLENVNFIEWLVTFVIQTNFKISEKDVKLGVSILANL